MSRLLPFFLFLAACPSGETACTDLAAASSLIHVVDAEGNPLVAEVVGEDADGNVVEATCADADPANCTNWIVGYEVEGVIVVRAEADDGCNTGTGEVTVDVPIDADGCHVVQQEADLVVSEWTDLDCG
jgi:hypothetical protein